jgi:hypothetical protein
MVRARASNSILLGALLAVAGVVAFRLPELLNPGVVNSDTAVVGLQGMHILRGQWHWFLWGSGYQTTADAAVAAAVFLLLGATPFALIATALLGHALATLFAYLTLCRRTAPGLAFLFVLPFVLSPAPTHTYTLHLPRQTALTLVFAALWTLDGAAGGRRPNVMFAVGAALAALSCFADPYALIFAPGLALLALMSAWDGVPSRGRVSRRLLAMTAGSALGSVPFVVCRLLPGAEHGPLTFSIGQLAHNWALLKYPCLPWTLGTLVLHQPANVSRYVPWHPPPWIHVCQWLGAGVLLASFAAAALGAFRRRFPWEWRRLWAFATLTFVLTFIGFLFSMMPMDLYASRYLVSLVLVTPLLLGVWSQALRARWLVALSAPMILSFALSGWLGFEPLVRGHSIVDARLETNEAQLLAELRRRDIKVAMADYWAAYRLTFLFQERVIVVPLHASQDRYAPYRQEFLRAERYAYIFDRRRSEESQRTLDEHVARGQEARFHVGPFDVYLVRRGTS